ncbi:HpcH/HpaI aldolase/citrate lyase family protein [Streptomyces sp. NPDC059850]|uniref:HpcH/HpaI aldolase family protein n=1 Tax=Streptomyces sp. NPDC059850 TaxID=3346970 RepID=UPI0036622ED3
MTYNTAPNNQRSGREGIRAIGFTSPSRGAWCTDASSGTVARLASHRFDWVCIDMQHGRYGHPELLEIARGRHPQTSADLVVRVPSAEFTGIGFALDIGAIAVIVPQVDSAESARAAVDAAFYPPLGRRSYGQIQPSWSAPAKDVAQANQDTVCAVMIESAAALENVEDIAAVPGVGMLFVGPYDLSLSLGTSVQNLLDDHSDDSALGRISAAADRNGLMAGAYGGDPSAARRLAERGFACTAWATDIWMAQAGADAAFA